VRRASTDAMRTFGARVLMIEADNRLGRGFIAAMLMAAAGLVYGQTTGDPDAGQQLFNTTLSPQCSGCHSITNAADPRSLTSIRTNITDRATPAGAAGTMSFAKALEALNAALTGTSLGNRITGMNGLFMLTTAQLGDLAAYIAQVTSSAPALRYSPASGPIFPGTAVGANASATATITNAGTADLVFATNNAVTIASGGDGADFRVTASTCPGITLRPNSGNCTINVTFQPSAGASLTRTASIGLTTASGTSLVPLAGSVVAGSPAPAAGDSAANPPAAGGGGTLDWLAAVGLLLSLMRNSPRPWVAWNSTSGATGKRNQ
jgi:mono/diheme cytochrome c family protein